MSTFQGLEIAKSGMRAYNTSLQTAAHNLANVATRGYSKQVVRTSAQTRNVSSIKVVGDGVYTQGIERLHNDYYDTKYDRAHSKYSKYTTHSYYLNEMQNRLYAKEEDTGGITTMLDEFCKRLTAWPTNSGDGTWRKDVTGYGDSFTRFVRETATNLQNLQEEANEEIKSCVDQVNAIAQKIVSVTKQINTLEAYGNVANDLRDQRSVLLDDLSEYCNIKVLEEEPADGVGLNQFYVYVDGAVLIDTYRVNELKIKEADTLKNINDIEGLYNVTWTDGSPFHPYSSTLGGKLQALFEIRDGNNMTTLKGKAKSLTEGADGKMLLSMDSSNVNNVNLLNIPAEDGELTIGSYTYTYDSFEVKVGADGEFTYEFKMKNNISDKQKAVLQNYVNKGGSVEVSETVDFKGVPYYMAQLNEFVRTYAQRFNDVHKEGYDLYGNQGIDFFNATVAGTGDNYIFTSKGDGYDSSFKSVAEAEANGTYTGSYYYMTALNLCVTDAVMRNENLLAANSVPMDIGTPNPVEDDEVSATKNSENLNAQKLSDLKEDSKMFLHGAPDSFLQSLTSDIGVDCQKSMTLEKSQKNIRDAVDLQRQMISGTDEDEEGKDLITFQQLLFHQYKVLSVMNEVLDKLINQTAV